MKGRALESYAPQGRNSCRVIVLSTAASPSGVLASTARKAIIEVFVMKTFRVGLRLELEGTGRSGVCARITKFFHSMELPL